MATGTPTVTSTPSLPSTVTSTNLNISEDIGKRSVSTPGAFSTTVERNSQLLATRTLREREFHRETTTLTQERGSDSLEKQLSALVATLGQMGDRPIALTINLDGRKVAESVYRDMQQRRVMAYE